MITAHQLNNVLKAQSESMDDVIEFKQDGLEYVEVGIDAEYAYFKVCGRGVNNQRGLQAIDYLKHKTRFHVISEKWMGNNYVMECKISA